MSDKRYRSFSKAVSWRCTAFLDTLFLSFLITGRLKWALSISGAEVITKIGLYYLHERFWNRLSFGKANKR